MENNKPTVSAPSKLWIRSEVLSVLNALSTMDQPTRHERQRQVKRLQLVENQPVVAQLLVKELGRRKAQAELQIIGEVLMELAEIEWVQHALWEIIRQPDKPDEVKDVANLVLRHLGDGSDPELYLDYLDDPAGLITRETQRMLEMAQQNPEALIDFLDFITSLPEDEQLHLLASLHEDYDIESLILLDEALLYAQGESPVCKVIVHALTDTLLSKAALKRLDAVLAFLEACECPNARALAGREQADWQESRDTLVASLRKAITSSRFKSLNSPPQKQTSVSTGLLESTKPGVCYATVPDGLGNQGLLLTRQWPNGDYSLVCTALHEEQGLLDAFGFYQLSEEELGRIRQKFHQNNTKIEVSPAYAMQRLNWAQRQTATVGCSLPYEYTCWKAAFDDIPPAEPLEASWLESHAKPELAGITHTLYQHPDFLTWYLETDDWEGLKATDEKLRDVLLAYGEKQQPEAESVKGIDTLATLLAQQFGKSSYWRNTLANRLTQTAYLMSCQEVPTFSTLAATEALTLKTTEQTTPFLIQFARRCVEEHLKQIKPSEGAQQAQFDELLQALAECWALPV